MSIYRQLFSLIFLTNFVFLPTFSFGNECKVKLIPKRDLRTFLFGFKTKWVVVPEINKYSECVNAAEELLNKVNGPFSAESLVDLFGKIIVSVFEPEYYKAVKVSYTNDQRHRYRTKIRYKKD